jgi:hypothetical protein
MSTTPPEDAGRPAYTPPPSASPESASSVPGHAPAPGYAPPPPAAERRAKGPSGLGIVAFVAALAGAIVGGVLAYIAGLQLGPLATLSSNGQTTVDPSDLTPEMQQAAATGGLLAVVAFVAMFVLALWGFIQGIVAAVRNRGRAWGIVAIVVAVLAWLPVVIMLGVGTAAGLASAG